MGLKARTPLQLSDGNLSTGIDRFPSGGSVGGQILNMFDKESWSTL